MSSPSASESCRRKALASLTLPALQETARRGIHPGLWLDRFLRTQDRSDELARRQLILEVSSLPVPPGYGLAFERWKVALESLQAEAKPGEVMLGVGQVQDRLVMGLGGASPVETHITLHQSYGVPYIPGSALKGLAASYARRVLDLKPRNLDGTLKGSKAPLGPYEVLFGDTDEAGYITYFDALPVVDLNDKLVLGERHPLQAAQKRRAFPDSLLETDVLTVHHRDYYMSDDAELKAPADWDAPNPVSFLSAVGSYLVALKGPEKWVRFAYEVLSRALEEEGVGAKTSSGYGRLKLPALEPKP
ncbi:MAG: type III-B CRISPR module RAMP protein Cmr6 [Myxococcota bacterium]